MHFLHSITAQLLSLHYCITSPLHHCTTSITPSLHNFYHSISAQLLSLHLCTTSITPSLHNFYHSISAQLLSLHLCTTSITPSLHNFYHPISAQLLPLHHCTTSITAQLGYQIYRYIYNVVCYNSQFVLHIGRDNLKILRNTHTPKRREKGRGEMKKSFIMHYFIRINDLTYSLVPIPC